MPDSTDTFGARCAKAACLKNLITMGALQPLADLIDAERAAVIAAHARKTEAAGMGPPPSSPPPPPSGTEDFGDRKKIPPTPEQVTAYFLFIDYPCAGEEFCDFYAAKGWKVGTAKMKDWQAACRNWKRSGWGKLVGPKKPGTEPRRITKF